MELMKTLLITLFLFLSFSTYSQQTLIGRVVDADSEDALSDVEVKLLSDSSSTVTNSLGYFEMTVSQGDTMALLKDGYVESRVAVSTQDRILIKILKVDRGTEMVDNGYEKGPVLEGRKVGIWEYYDNEVLALKIDYDNFAIDYFRYDTSAYAIQMGGEWVLKQLDRQPRYVGSFGEYYKIFASNLSFPREARQQSTTGTVHLTFVIDPQGMPGDFAVVNDLGYGVGEEVLRVAEMLSDGWMPALLDGETYPARFAMPIVFEIKDRPTKKRNKKKLDPLPLAKELETVVVTAVGVPVRSSRN